MNVVNKAMAYNKAIAVGVVGVIAVGARYFGVEIQPELELALLTLVTAFIVWLVPNK